jgi:hypothetical protein
MLAEMMGASIRGDNQMIYPLTYVFLACMLFCIFSQLHWLALGLRFFDALYVVPVFQWSGDEDAASTAAARDGHACLNEASVTHSNVCMCCILFLFQLLHFGLDVGRCRLFL